MKTGLSALPLIAGELKGPQNEGEEPGDLSVNTDGTCLGEVRSGTCILVCTLMWKEMVPRLLTKPWAQARHCMSLAQAESRQGTG